MQQDFEETIIMDGNEWWCKPGLWRFAMQACISLISLIFGILLYYVGYKEEHRTIGISIVTTVLGLWMQTPIEPIFCTPQVKKEEQDTPSLEEAPPSITIGPLTPRRRKNHLRRSGLSSNTSTIDDNINVETD